MGDAGVVVSGVWHAAEMFSRGDQHLFAAAADRRGVFTYRDALQAGLTARQATYRAAKIWARVHDGVFRLPGAPATWESDLVAACRAATEPVGVSHRAAAQIYDLPGRQELVEITCRRWRRTQSPGIVVHESTRFGPEDIQVVDGIPVSIPERVLLELAGWNPSPNYVEAVIHAARRKRLITYESTLETFSRLARPGVRGVRAMRVALERWTLNTAESEMETRLLQVLRNGGLPEPVLQYEVHNDRGEFVARVDAALPQWRITIDYDSKQEHSDEFQLARDARRRDEILAAGYFPLTARHGDLVRDGDELIERILRIARRSAS
jgi:hypothetical protein